MAKVSLHAFKMLSKSNKEIPYYVRWLLISLLPKNPLKENRKLPLIEVTIPVTKKDFPVLNYTILGLVNCIENPIKMITLVSPNNESAELNKLVTQISSSISELNSINFRLLNDFDYLGRDLNFLIESYVKEGRSGWVRQQLVKIQSSFKSEIENMLVCDADTVFISKIRFVNSNKHQILHVGYDRHEPYLANIEKNWGVSTRRMKWSFVTHFQLLQKDIVLNIFGKEGEKIPGWIGNCDFAEASMLSEYETYGQLASIFFPQRVKFVRWNNIGKSRSYLSTLENLDLRDAYSQIKKNFRPFGSVSFHSYL